MPFVAAFVCTEGLQANLLLLLKEEQARGARGPSQPVAALFATGRTGQCRAEHSSGVCFYPWGCLLPPPPMHLLPRPTPAGIKPPALPEPRAGLSLGGCRHPCLPMAGVTDRLPSQGPAPPGVLLPNRHPRAEQMSFPFQGRFHSGYIPIQHLEPPSIALGNVTLVPTNPSNESHR